MLGLNRYQLLCLAYVTFGSAFYGYDSGITTSVLAYENFLTYFKLGSARVGALNSTYYASCAIGNLLNWYLPDRIGSLNSIRIACIISLVGIVIQTAAVNFAMLVVGRIIGGIACGIVYAVCPVYASEISPPAIRGRIGAVYAFNVSSSYMITEWLGLGFYFIPGQASWRLLFGLQVLPGAGMLIASFWMPFSPRWLALKGRYDESLEVLKRIHGGHQDDTFYKQEFHQIKTQIELDKEEQLGLKAIFSKPSYRRRILLVMGFFLFQQLTGIIPLQNYQVFVYQIVGFDAIMSLVMTGVWGTIAVIAVIVFAPIFDRVGRRFALLLSYAFIIPASIITVSLWATFEATGSTNVGIGKGVVAGMFLTVFGYAGVMNTFAPCYSAEIMPTCIRAAGVACGYFMFNAIVILLVQVTPIAIDAISWKFFLIFLILDCVFVVIVYFFYPETKNKTLEEIEAVFGDRLAETLDEAGRHINDDPGLVSAIDDEEKASKIGVQHVESLETKA